MHSFTNIIQGTHFRGSMISWRIINDSSSSLTLQIIQRHAWRYTYYTNPLCTTATIPDGLPILGQTAGYNIICASSCPTGLTILGNVSVPCTGYNINEQYAMGEGRFIIQVPQNSSFVAKFSSTAWFSLVTGNNLLWSVAVQIQTFKRSDTGGCNNAPIVTMLPIYRLRNQISYTIKINVADNDFDPYICLWSQGTTQCGGLVNSVPGGTVDNYGCYLYFTPNISGYYAACTNSGGLRDTTDQYNIYELSFPSDLVPDFCIYMAVGDTYTTRVRFQVQCANATVDSIISVNPTGLLMTALQQDPFDPTIYAFLSSFTSSDDQLGQNLFCFAAVDSIGNQGDSACLRFTVLSQTSSLQSLYTQNATRYPMGTVSKTTSLWTILTGSRVYVRPTTEAYIRFKQVSDNVDYYVLNVVTATDRVLYYSDRIVINSSVVWSTGESFYIYFDAGALVQASTCSKEAMPIADPNFWPFDIPYETTTTSTSSTTTTSASSTTTGRTTPTRRTLGTSSTITSTTTSTTTRKTTSSITTSTKIVRTIYRLPISAIVGITLVCLFISALLIWIIYSIIQVALIRFLLLQSGLRQQLLGIHCTPAPDLYYNQTKSNNLTSVRQYKVATRHHQQQSAGKYAVSTNKCSFQENLVESLV